MASPSNSAPSPAAAHCPQCGAQLAAPGGKCWLCGGQSWPPPTVAPPPAGPLQFGISSLLLFTTLCAICLSITSMNPGLGVMLAVLAAPALVRTCLLAARRSRSGEPMSAGGKVAVFLITLSMIWTVIVATIAAFFATALATCAIGSSAGYTEAALAVPAMVVGVIMAVVIAVGLALLFWWLSRKMDRRTRR